MQGLYSCAVFVTVVNLKMDKLQNENCVFCRFNKNRWRSADISTLKDKPTKVFSETSKKRDADKAFHLDAFVRHEPTFLAHGPKPHTVEIRLRRNFTSLTFQTSCGATL